MRPAARVIWPRAPGMRAHEEDSMTPQQFETLMAPVIDAVAGKPVDAALAAALNREFPASGETVGAIERACHEAIADGWMCAQGKPGRKFGRVIEAKPESRDLSVDVVDLVDIVGPHHVHPNGEVCLVLPVTEGAKFMGGRRTTARPSATAGPWFSICCPAARSNSPGGEQDQFAAVRRRRRPSPSRPSAAPKRAIVPGSGTSWAMTFVAKMKACSKPLSMFRSQMFTRMSV